MAAVELGSFAQHLDDEEVAAIARALKTHDVKLEPSEVDTAVLARDLDDQVVADFLDRLDAHDAGADIYVPAEFDGVVRAAGYKIGSAPQLLSVLDELKEELRGDDDEGTGFHYGDEEDEGAYDDDEEEEEDDGEATDYWDQRMQDVWDLFYKAAHQATAAGIVMFVKT